MELSLICTIIGTGLGVISFIYVFLRNFRTDIDGKSQKIEDKFDKRFDKIDEKFNKIDEKFERIEVRLSRIEGYLEGMEFWKPENIKKTGTK